jgi:archaellum component FlaF (FlaF/FlaG flagellin family)
MQKYFIRLLYRFMDSFQITVLLVAAILLIAIFTTVGILSKYSTEDKVYPPISNTCPDYWAVDASGNCVIPSTTGMNVGSSYASGSINFTTDINQTNNIYTPGYISDGNKINFSDPLWGTLGKSVECAKKSWATQSKVVWDGISNYNSCK